MFRNNKCSPVIISFDVALNVLYNDKTTTKQQYGPGSPYRIIEHHTVFVLPENRSCAAENFFAGSLSHFRANRCLFG